MRAVAPLLLAAYAVAVPAVGADDYCGVPCPQRASWMGIAVWHAFTVTVVASALQAGLILAIAWLRVWADWASLRACVMSVLAQYASAGGAVASMAGGVVILGGQVGWPGSRARRWPAPGVAGMS